MKVVISERVQKMLDSRDTELQRAYDNATNELLMYEELLQKHEKAVNTCKSKISNCRIVIAKCLDKAEEHNINLLI